MSLLPQFTENLKGQRLVSGSQALPDNCLCLAKAVCSGFYTWR